MSCPDDTSRNIGSRNRNSSRREALRTLLGGVLGLFGLGGLLRPGEAVSADVGGSESLHGPAQEKKRVCKLEDLPPGSSTKVRFLKQPVLVFNVDETVKAFSAICTHEGCVVGWSESDQDIECPCHGGEFDTDGKVIAGPPPAPLFPFDTVVEDGVIFLVYEA